MSYLPEINAKNEFILNKSYDEWTIFKNEWEVIPGLPQYGIGDLVMKRPDKEYVVVEIKVIGKYDKDKTLKRKIVNG